MFEPGHVQVFVQQLPVHVRVPGLLPDLRAFPKAGLHKPRARRILRAAGGCTFTIAVEML
jgi:hypothetical protein